MSSADSLLLASYSDMTLNQLQLHYGTIRPPRDWKHQAFDWPYDQVTAWIASTKLA